MKNILLIGGSGFVGTRLIHEINEKYNLLNIDKNNSDFFADITVLGDVRNLEPITEKFKNIDTIILLAAEHRDDIKPSSLYYDVNVSGTENVLKAMDDAEIKNLIFTSSVAIYGLNKSNPDESHPKDPFNDYGKSKWQAEKLIKEWYNSNSEGKSVTIIRPTVIFGERNRGNVYNLLKQISKGKFLMIGSGMNKKSMAYVGNVVALIKDQIEKNKLGFNVFNYADKPDFSMLELISLIENKMNISIPKIKIPYSIAILFGYIFDLIHFLTKKKFPVSSVRIKKFCATTQFNSSKVHNTFNKPFTLKEGLDRTLEHEFINKKKDDVLFCQNN